MSTHVITVVRPYWPYLGLRRIRDPESDSPVTVAFSRATVGP